jgi:hypothetical protein
MGRLGTSTLHRFSKNRYRFYAGFKPHLSGRTNKDAEKRLVSYLEKDYGAVRYNSGPMYSRLLFQSARGLSKLSTANKVEFVEANSSMAFRINESNINKHRNYTGRHSIKPDALAKNIDRDVYCLGEAKGTHDKTGEFGGATFSCAHKIAYDLVSDNTRLNKLYKGYTHSLLSQCLGYIDAVAHQLKEGRRMFYFVWLICDADAAIKNKYDALGPAITSNLNMLFPAHAGAINFKGHLVRNICYFFSFEVDTHKASLICDALSHAFIDRYFKKETSMRR